MVTHSPAIISCSPIHLSSQSPVSMDRISPEANLMSPSLSPDLANIVSPNLLGGDAVFDFFLFNFGDFFLIFFFLS